LTLKRCEIDDPYCKARKAIEDRIHELYSEGYTSKEIVEYFRQSALPSVDELRRHIKAERESKRPVILYFYSETCSTCIKVRPKIEELEQEIPGINLFTIEKQFHDAIFSEYNVKTYPMLIVLVGENEYRKKFSEHDDILSFVQEHLD
jgi:thiol-disulfide isomerase/thioredoxin